MTPEQHWIGDLGHLALADAFLGAMLIDMLTILTYADYPAPTLTIDSGLTTKQAAKDILRRLEAEPDLLGEAIRPWLADVIAVADLRNDLLHAVALNRCGICGTATRFIHPRSGRPVDRSEQAVRNLTARALALYEDGRLLADQIAARVNQRIVAQARLTAEATGEVQNPPQAYPHHATHKCGSCTGTGAGSTTMQLGTAVVVYPSARKKELVKNLRMLTSRERQNRK